MADATEALRLQMLAWIAERPRTYRETMDAWRTSCPRLPIWEDAVDDGLVEVVNNPTTRAPRVSVTARGFTLLRSAETTALQKAPERAPEPPFGGL